MEHRNVHAFAQLALNLKTFRGLDVFQIDGAKCGFEAGDDINQFFNGALRHFNVKDIDSSKFLEQNRLAFHDGL